MDFSLYSSNKSPTLVCTHSGYKHSLIAFFLYTGPIGLPFQNWQPSCANTHHHFLDQLNPIPLFLFYRFSHSFALYYVGYFVPWSSTGWGEYRAKE